MIQTGMRTDIPAFYFQWFANSLKAGEVCVSKPYYPRHVTRYRLSPEVVDLIGFCTKNPHSMLRYMELLKPYGQYWFITVTPYGKEIDPGVPPKEQVLGDAVRLSRKVGPGSVCLRYDPVFFSKDCTEERHLAEFETMASALEGSTKVYVISFIKLYAKVRRNFPEVRDVKEEEHLFPGREMIRIVGKHGMTVKPARQEGNWSLMGLTAMAV